MKIALSLLLIWFFCLPAMAETEPPAEYPYPQKRRPAAEVDGVEQPVKKDNRGGYYYDTGKKKKRRRKKVIDGVEKPYKIGDDGTYYYSDDEDKKQKANTIDGVEQPIDTDDEGGYYYKRSRKKKRKSKAKYGPKPVKINEDGSYIYDTHVDETTNNLYIRAGVMSAPDIQPVSAGGRDYSQVYGDSSNFIFNVGYDWILLQNLFLKVDLGFTNSEGEGQFADASLNSGEIAPKEKFQFFIVPTLVNLHYRLQIWDIQWLTPYVEGGPGYFGFVEIRSDGDSTKFGGAPVLAGAAGLLISLTKFMDGTGMSTDYGITQTWLDIQFKQILGLDSRKDFTSNIITGGIAVGF